MGTRNFSKGFSQRLDRYFCQRESQNIWEPTAGLVQFTDAPWRSKSTRSPSAKVATQTNQPSSKSGLGANMPQYCSQCRACPNPVAEPGNQASCRRTSVSRIFQASEYTKQVKVMAWASREGRRPQAEV